jgi:protein O-GlcNAc transferase
MEIMQAIESAFELQNEGKLDQAEYIYREILRIQANNVLAHYNLGIICQDKLQFDKAIYHYKKALDLDPNIADAYFNMGTIFHDRGLLDDAIRNYQAALELDPNSADINNNIGLVLKEKGQLDEAISYYHQALQINSHLANAFSNIGVVLKEKGQLDEAIFYYHQALQINPDRADFYFNLGSALQEKGHLDESIVCYRKAIELNAGFAYAYNNLGSALRSKKIIDDAIINLKKALQLNPEFFHAYNNLGLSFQDKGQLDDAIGCYQEALRINSNCSEVYNNVGCIFQEIGQVHKACDFFREALKRNPHNPSYYSNLLLSLNYSANLDASTIYHEHLQFSKYCTYPISSITAPYNNKPIPGRRLKIGYISPDFRKQSVGFFIEPILESHNHNDFEIFCYYNYPALDEMTARMKLYADQWRHIIGMTDEKVTELIRDDQIDILVDLAGHTAFNRLRVFACKPAPVQVSWLGYPNTTGLSAIDYRLVDNHTDPPDTSDRFYTETLLRLPDTFLCYRPYQSSPEVKELPYLTNGHLTFGSFNILTKLTPEVISLWSQILKRIENSKLLIKRKSLSSRIAREYVFSQFIQHDIDPKSIELMAMTPIFKEHLEIYNRIDICLDTFPYNGTTTTCEALWMGVPVITLVGNTHVSRVGHSLLLNIGLNEFIANTHEEYIEIAVNLSKDLKKLRSLRTSLRAMMKHSPLCDAIRFTGNLEKTYRQIWKIWCRAV